MGGGLTPSSALPTMLAFDYQACIALDLCFELEQGQSIWIERDGDVSVLGSSSEEKKSHEVKQFSDALTDNHENLWKTLKNWLDPEFEQYQHLILYTTQPFGEKATIKDWNDLKGNERLKLLKAIYLKRPESERLCENPKAIVKHQRTVINTSEATLLAMLQKVKLVTEADNREELLERFKAKRLSHVPETNQQRYTESLHGFIYAQANPNQWVITKEKFNEVQKDLASRYCLDTFPFPALTGKPATREQVDLHNALPLLQKIQAIDYQAVIPDALGLWLEYSAELSQLLDESPMNKQKHDEYERQLVNRFKNSHKRVCLENVKSKTCKTLDSQIFYHNIMEQESLPMGQDLPPIEYKNGCIHDAMNNEYYALQWSLETK